MGGNEYVTMLLNFRVLPVLMSKEQALHIYTVCEGENDGDGEADAILFPSFLEALAQVGVGGWGGRVYSSPHSWGPGGSSRTGAGEGGAKGGGEGAGGKGRNGAGGGGTRVA